MISEKVDFQVLLIGKKAGFSYSMYRYFSCLRDGLEDAGILVNEALFDPKWTRWIPPGKLREWGTFFEMAFCFSSVLKERIKTLKESSSQRLIVHVCDHSDSIVWSGIKSELGTITLHDCIPMRVLAGEFEGVKKGFFGRLQQRWIYRNLNQFTGIVAISECTLSHSRKYLKDERHPVVMVSNGPSVPFKPISRDEAEKRLAGDESYLQWVERGRPKLILSVSGDLFYKNRSGILSIFKALKKGQWGDLMLVSIGPCFGEKAVGEFKDSIIECSGLSNTKLEAWYNLSDLLLFPSLAEGFGWPLLEALQTRCLIVTTDEAPMNEVAGEGAVYLKNLSSAIPDDEWVRESAEKVNDLLLESDVLQSRRRDIGELHARQFSRDNMVNGYLKFWEMMLKNEREVS